MRYKKCQRLHMFLNPTSLYLVHRHVRSEKITLTNKIALTELFFFLSQSAVQIGDQFFLADCLK